jgi:hypothetical protein
MLEKKIQKIRGDESLERVNPIENWKKLLIKASENKSTNFKIRSTSMIVSKLRAKKEKMKGLTVAGKWNFLT